MQQLAGILKEELGVLQEENNPFGKVVYHGGKYLMTYDSLDLGRTSITRDATGRIVETASDMKGVGLYVSLDIWVDDPSQNNKIINPVFKEGSKGLESAQKYATGKSLGYPPAYIYRVELADNINLESYGYKNIVGRNIGKDQMEALLKEGIDGLYSGKTEAVILNKDKITSFKLVYKAEDNMLMVQPGDKNKINKWMDARGKENYIEDEWVAIKKNTLDSHLKQILGNEYTELNNDGKSRIFSNAPEDSIEHPSKYSVKDYKFYYVKNEFLDWVKV